MKTQSVKFWHIATALALLLVLTLIVPVSAQTVQLIQNGGFETGDLSFWPMTKETVSATSEEAHTGTYSAKVISGGGMPPFMPNEGYIIQQNLDPSGWPSAGDGKQYMTISAYVKTDASDTLSLGTEFCSNADCSSSCTILDRPNETRTGPTTGWEQFSATFEIPAGTQCIYHIVLAHTGDNVSTVYWDDVTAYSSTPTAVTVQGFGAQRAVWPVLALGTLALGAVLVFFRKRR